jgi:hypothetical protein
MNTASLISLPWYSDLSLDEAGIWTIRGGRCAIGIVLLAQHGSEIIAVRKARVAGYEFSNLLALPGGLVRADSSSRTFYSAVERSLYDRALRECGLRKEAIENLRLVEADFPVTSYTAKGQRRFTLVVAARCEIYNFIPAAADRSISEAVLLGAPLPLHEFAPANRIILAKCLPGTIWSAHDLSSLHEARVFCEGNARALDAAK